jgi:hypothetical protein
MRRCTSHIPINFDEYETRWLICLLHDIEADNAGLTKTGSSIRQGGNPKGLDGFTRDPYID